MTPVPKKTLGSITHPVLIIVSYEKKQVSGDGIVTPEAISFFLKSS